MKTFYLVDFENLKEEALKATEKAADTDLIYIFYTENTPKVGFDVLSMQKTKNIEYIKAKAGKQSLDMCLVSYLGYLIGKHGLKNKYVIVSDDTDYDKVISLWEEQKITAVSRLPAAPEKTKKEKNKKAKVPDKNAVISKIGTVLEKEKVGKDKAKGIVSAVSNNIEKENRKYEVYRALVQKYGQNEGLKYYNMIKSSLKT